LENIVKLQKKLKPYDEFLVERYLNDFVPNEIYDAHAHLLHDGHYHPDYRIKYLDAGEVHGAAEYQAALAPWLPGRKISSLLFGMPTKDNARSTINEWVAGELQTVGGTNRGIALASPYDDPETVAADLQRLGLIGLKPYHVYGNQPDTRQLEIEEFTPEWMWEVCDSINGILMLHIMRDAAISDEKNQEALRRLCRKYPNCRVVLAHIARSFNYRHSYEGLASVRDLDNVWVDTSAITETPAFTKAIEVLGPQRILFGTDYPISNIRGKCTAVGGRFQWSYDTSFKNEADSEGMTLVGIESLLALREACEENGLTRGDIEDIFNNNALRLLAPHLDEADAVAENTGRAGVELWDEARTKISNGTGLLSKWAERYDIQSWPTYFSRCKGCEIWDLEGRRFVDFHGGIGSILLGYGDTDVNRAVQRRVAAGSMCGLISPDEVQLADTLLELHPWAGRVRYARGGGDAMTVAVRVARAATGRSGIAFCGYHGWHDWYLAANLGDEAGLDGHLLPGLQPLGVPRELRGTSVGFRYNDYASFEEALDKLDSGVAAVVMEPMRSQYPQDDFLEKIAARCKRDGIVLIIDEITSGWRFGFPGALQKLGVEPDIAVYAKAMSNGFPCAAVVGRAEIMDAANASFISSTYWTDGVGPAAALAAVGKMRDLNVQQDIWKKGEVLQANLQKLIEAHPASQLTMSGMPAATFLAFNLGEATQAARALLIRKMVSRGYLVSGLFYTMLAHEPHHFDSMLGALDETLSEIDLLAETGRVQEEAGTVGAAGFARLA
jgi:glutamate-1-semialdehyde 2,1-aminomutase